MWLAGKVSIELRLIAHACYAYGYTRSQDQDGYGGDGGDGGEKETTTDRRG